MILEVPHWLKKNYTQPCIFKRIICGLESLIPILNSWVKKFVLPFSSSESPKSSKKIEKQKFKFILAKSGRFYNTKSQIQGKANKCIEVPRWATRRGCLWLQIPDTTSRNSSPKSLAQIREVKLKIPCLERWGEHTFPGAKVVVSLKKHTGQSYLQSSLPVRVEEKKDSELSISAESNLVKKSKG